MDTLKQSKMFANLVLLSLIGITIYIFSRITFIFRPIEALLASVFAQVLISIFLYYIFLPLFKQLAKRTHHRIFSICVVIGLVLLSGFLLVQFVAPILIVEIRKLLEQVPNLLTNLNKQIESVGLSKPGLPMSQAVDIHQVSQLLLGILSGARTSVAGIIELISHSAITLLTIPLILFYLFRDGEKIPEKMANLSPKRYQQLVRNWCEASDQAASTYISGKLLVCLYVGISSYLVFRVLGLPNALLLGMICGVLDIIPYFGPFIGVIPAILYAISEGSRTTVLLMILITMIQIGESYVVSPIVMKQMSEIHPIVGVFALLVAGNLFGLVGMIIALPMYTICS